MSEEPSEWEQERDAVHSTLAQVINELRGDMLLSTVVIAVTVNDQGEKTLSCWTSPDQRQWETMGLLDYVHSDHQAHLAERRIRFDGTDE